MNVDRLPLIIRRDWLRKSVALVFAILLWLYVKGQLSDVLTLHDIPVTLEYDRSALCLEKDTVPVNVRVRGSKEKIDKLRGSNLKITVHIPTEEVPRGKLTYDLRVLPEHVNSPLGIRVESIDPPIQQIPVDLMETKIGVPIRVRYAGKLADGYEVGRCAIVPSQVDIRAPANMLQDIQELVTDLVPLDETLTSGFEMDKKLVAIPKVVAGASIVHVQVEIVKQYVQQAYESLLITSLVDPFQPWEIVEPLPAATVVLRGPQMVLDGMDKTAIRPFVDLSKITVPGHYRRPVEVWTGGVLGVTADITPRFVDVTVVDQSSDFSMPLQTLPGVPPALPPAAASPSNPVITRIEVIPIPVPVPENRATPEPTAAPANQPPAPLPGEPVAPKDTSSPDTPSPL